MICCDEQCVSRWEKEGRLQPDEITPGVIADTIWSNYALNYSAFSGVTEKP
jgi:hypothetical protein